METINKILKRDASYASTNMVVDMSVTTPTTKIKMRANVPRLVSSTEASSVDKTVKSGNIMEESLGVARKALFMNIGKQTLEKATRSEDDSSQKLSRVHKPPSKAGAGALSLFLVPFDVNKAPLSFEQMEQIQAAIIDLLIEHKDKDVTPDSLNCQFKNGWMAFKCCNALTAEWLKLNCNNISKKCKVNLKVVEEISQKERDQAVLAKRLKKNYYLALYHLKKIKKAKESGAPLNNETFLLGKYRPMLQAYVDTLPKKSKAREYLRREGLLSKRKKKRKPSGTQYCMALYHLNELKDLEDSGTILNEKQLKRRRRLQVVVDEYLTKKTDPNHTILQIGSHQSMNDHNNKQPLDGVITDPLCVAFGGKRKGLFVPVCKEWPQIKLEINKLVTSYILKNGDTGLVPRYDLSVVHRGFRLIKCMDKFSKDFLAKCIDSIKDNWKALELMTIPASQIPKGIREPIDLDAEAISHTFYTASSRNAKTMSAASKNLAWNKDFKTSLKYNETKQTAAPEGNLQCVARHSQTNNPFRKSDLQLPQVYNLRENTTTSLDKPDNSQKNLVIKQYLSQKPQAPRRTVEFWLQKNRFNPVESTVSRETSEYLAENSSLRREISPTSWQTKNVLSSEESAPHEALKWRRDRDPTKTQTLIESEGFWKLSSVSDNASSNKRQFSQDSSGRNDRFPASNETSRHRSRESNLTNLEDWRRSQDSPTDYVNPSRNGRLSAFNEPSRLLLCRERNPTNLESWQPSLDSPTDYGNPGSNSRFPVSNETSRPRSRERNPTNLQDWRRSQDIPTDYGNPGSNSRFPASNETSRPRSRERNSTSLEDWRRSAEFYESSRSNVREFYRNSPPNSSNPYRTGRRSGEERNPVQTHILMHSECRWKSLEFYENLDSSPNRNRNPEPTFNETLMRSRKRNSNQTSRSPDFHTKTAQAYEDSPPHCSNPSLSFSYRHHEPDTFDILPSESGKYNVRSRECYRSKRFHDVSRHRDFEDFSNHLSQPDSRNSNNSYSRREEHYLPSDDDDLAPPPPKWN